MGKIIHNISKIISEEGIIVFFSKTLRYIRKNIVGVTKVFIYEFDLNNITFKINSGLDIFIRLATEKDIDLMDYENYNYDENVKKYAKERLEKGDTCILALYNGKLIGYVWIMYDLLEISKFNLISLSKNRGSFYNIFILKELRGKRIANSLDYYINDMLRKSGKRYIVILVDKDNIASIKNRERAGYKKIGYINQFRFFGLKYDYLDKKLLLYLQKQ